MCLLFFCLNPFKAKLEALLFKEAYDLQFYDLSINVFKTISIT